MSTYVITALPSYSIYCRDEDRIKHFLIDASVERCYFLFGNDQLRHDSLKELLEYHKVTTVIWHVIVIEYTFFYKNQ